jgi:hypothetical protein
MFPGHNENATKHETDLAPVSTLTFFTSYCVFVICGWAQLPFSFAVATAFPPSARPDPLRLLFWEQPSPTLGLADMKR